MGPDTFTPLDSSGQPTAATPPPVLRYAAVGSLLGPAGRIYFDLVVANMSTYSPYDASLNGLDGAESFARINVAANSEVQLRVYVRPSCCSMDTCRRCDQLGAPGSTAVNDCYSNGCCCVNVIAFSPAACATETTDQRRASYFCNQMDILIVLPRTEMVSITVYDLDSGPNGNYREEYVTSEFEYYKTPLRSDTGNTNILSSILVAQNTGTFQSPCHTHSVSNRIISE